MRTEGRIITKICQVILTKGVTILMHNEVNLIILFRRQTAF